ncbi:DgyrCDS2848 [Dimorphilus gyrociliatus]|uniref:DgyrCDS2848 n=1 Tax=Dimorphilus gyrociliatus TaxID=2664684 RepID=A0A7I8VBM4_9ANNE|nr:DgyrCDS2848 [Dimorphilus gyrociliatus]
MFFLSLSTFISGSNGAFLRVTSNYFRDLQVARLGIISSIFGGMLMGIGFSLSGSCPMTIWSQVGAMVPNSMFVVYGACVGTLIYCLITPLRKHLETSESSPTNPYKSGNYAGLSLPLAVMFGMLVVAFEMLSSWRQELSVYKARNTRAPTVFHMRAWPPYAAGVCVGVFQVLHMFSVDTLMGCSKNLTIICSKLLRKTPLGKLCQERQRFNTWFDAVWPIVFTIFIAGGSYYSASLSNSFQIVKGVKASDAFIGGIFLFLGARIAGGCTMGHGLSGLSLLSILSLITIGSTYSFAMMSAYYWDWRKKFSIGERDQGRLIDLLQNWIL